MAVEKGYTDFIRHEHVYPIYAPDKAIQDARKILIHVDTNAIVFSNWDKLYSMVYTAQLVANRKDVAFHEAYIFDDQPRLTDAHIKFINDNIDTRPIYFMMKLDNFADFYRVEQVGDSLYRLYRK